MALETMHAGRVRASPMLVADRSIGCSLIAAAGVLFILSSKRIVQEAHEVDDLLYGSAVLVSTADVWVLFLVTAAILLLHVLFYKPFIFVTYDGEMARTLGYHTDDFCRSASRAMCLASGLRSDQRKPRTPGSRALMVERVADSLRT